MAVNDSKKSNIIFRRKVGGWLCSVTRRAKAHYRYMVFVSDNDGKRKERWFVAKGDALEEAARLCGEAEAAGVKNIVTDGERAAILAFRDGVKSLPDPKPTLAEAVNLYLQGLGNRTKPITVEELVELRLSAAKARGLHHRTLIDLGGADGTRGRLGAFARAFPDKQVVTITTEEVEAWLDKHCVSTSSRREMLVRLNGLFALAVKREYIAKNPIGKIPLPARNAPKATILTNTQCAALLAACAPASLPAVAIQLFAGLRLAEAQRLRWEDIDFDRDSLRVTQRKGAGNRREKLRHVPIQPVLKAWLQPHKREAGTVLPPTPRKKHVGQGSAQMLRNDFDRARTAAKLESWDANTLRHTFASNRLAVLQDVEKLRYEMGHTEGRTALEHYVNLVHHQEARAFWNLFPKSE